MFNALTPQELLIGIGRVLRLVAAAPGALEEYERSQTLSAYSVTRLLAAEQAATADLLERTRSAFHAALDGDERAAVRTAAGKIDAARDGVALGDAVAELLPALARDEPLRRRLHGVLAEMIDSEVAALAAVAR